MFISSFVLDFVYFKTFYQMDKNQRKSLVAKKHQINVQIDGEKLVDESFITWLKIYDVILSKNIRHQVARIANITDPEIILWKKAVSMPPLNQYNFDLKSLNTSLENNLNLQLYRSFPSLISLHFEELGDLDEKLMHTSNNAGEMIIHFTDSANINLDREVYLIYVNYPPIIKLKLKDVADNAETLYNFPLEDILITDIDFNWVILLMKENKWKFLSKDTGRG